MCSEKAENKRAVRRDEIRFYSLPVDAPLRITSPFGQRNTGIPGASTYHSGIDLGRNIYKPETAVIAVAPGEIVKSYWNDYRGWVVVVDHEGFQTLCQHLKAKAPPPGVKVRTGQQLGIMGNSSDPDKLKIAVHLHFELRVGGVLIDPEPYLQDIRKEEYDLTESEVRKIVKNEINRELNRLGISQDIDSSQPSGWAEKFWQWGREKGITDGRSPKGICTREQTVTMLKKLYDLIEQPEGRYSKAAEKDEDALL